MEGKNPEWLKMVDVESKKGLNNLAEVLGRVVEEKDGVSYLCGGGITYIEHKQTLIGKLFRYLSK